MHTDELAAATAPLRPFPDFGGTENNLISGATPGSTGAEYMTRDTAPSILGPQAIDRPRHLFWSFLENSGKISVTNADNRPSNEISTSSSDFHMPKPATSNLMQSLLRRPQNSHEYNIVKLCKTVIEEEENVGIVEEDFGAMRKKKRLTGEQLRTLEGSFEADRKLEADRKQELAQRLGLEPRQIAVWFQNRRARSKTKHLEHDYALLKAQYHSVLAETLKLRAEVTRLTAELGAATSKGNEEDLDRQLKPKCEVDGSQYEQQEGVTALISNTKKVMMAASSPSICCSTESHTVGHSNSIDADHHGSHGRLIHADGDGGSSHTSPISSICGCHVAPNDEPLPSHDRPSSNTHISEMPSNTSSCGAQPSYNTLPSPPYNAIIKPLPPKDLHSCHHEISTMKPFPNNYFPSSYHEISSINHLPCHNLPSSHHEIPTIHQLPSNSLPFTHHDTSCRHTLHLQNSSSTISQLPYGQNFTPCGTVEYLPSNFNNIINDRSSDHLLKSTNTIGPISGAPNHKFIPLINLNHSTIPVCTTENSHETIESHQVPFSNYDGFFFSQHNQVGVECSWHLTTTS
ncbi:hypothetical protein GOP47_0000811 [Adiantum capillus-veneris]|uniref:Homeobox domain-containing protein n=1 Tax=Adiantum capillus-veneris TaxID=13818 RepID=A0A9D4VFU0_ADICA|nr:hypothetical protein GOP47_0000811 [Adiantum capillus-veneris]